MFGLAELARLKLYEGTLRQAETDGGNLKTLHGLALASGLSALGRCVLMSGDYEQPFEIRPTIVETVGTIPSSALNGADTIFLQSIQPGGVGREAIQYHVLSLLNALVFVRIVEVARPRLTVRAHQLRDNVDAFLDPAFEFVLSVIATTSSQTETGRLLPTS